MYQVLTHARISKRFSSCLGMRVEEGDVALFSPQKKQQQKTVVYKKALFGCPMTRIRLPLSAHVIVAEAEAEAGWGVRERENGSYNAESLF